MKLIDSRNIDELHPALRRGAAEFLKRMRSFGYDALITSTYRDGEAQNALYAKGRSAAGVIVTNARAGQSMHNYRLAFDVCKNVKGQEYADAGFFELAGAVWQDMGGAWGGAWKSFPDRPHMEFTNGLTIARLQSGAVLPYNATMRWEQESEGVNSVVKLNVNGEAFEIAGMMINDTNYGGVRQLLEKLGYAVTWANGVVVAKK